MNNITEGSLLWQPSAEVIEAANLTRYMTWLKEKHGLNFEDYHQVWQ